MMFGLPVVGVRVLYIEIQIFPPIKQHFAFLPPRSKISTPSAVDRTSDRDSVCSLLKTKTMVNDDDDAVQAQNIANLAQPNRQK
jgi:hypothetical protein